MILALFTPEFISIWALKQRIGAGIIMKEYNRTALAMRGKPSKSLFDNLREWLHGPAPQYAEQWTLAHAFYVQMGGLVLYNPETKQEVRVVHCDELLQWIQCGLIEPPEITEEEIRDKSKGDFLTKLFVVIQTTWFIVQCIARWITHLPVTELEILTLSFAVLNIATYVLWWEKPQNISVGMRLRLKPGLKHNGTHGATDPATEVDITDSYQYQLRQHERQYNPHATWKGQGEGEPEPEGVNANANADANTLPPMDRTHSGTRAVLNKISTFFVGTLLLIYKGTLRGGLVRWIMDLVVGPLFQTHPTTITGSVDSLGLSSRPIHPSRTRIEAPVLPSSGPLAVKTFYAYFPAGIRQKKKAAAFTAVTGMVFGGLHLIPWKSTFPTRAESILWRVSALYITLNPIILSLVFGIIILAATYSHEGNHRGVDNISACLYLIIPVFKLVHLVTPLYIFARLFTLVIAFSALRALPPDAYKDISWNTFIPHI
ncbi:hypothetical protein P691DRAFT_805045 [Macrolepiota fuliginosa MF-IS2]|uniref:Uncharacterized protein n=1 Tax=Macrolepiota fuliginosa MF-IS2 TaxID=1400762 RepID=A0A9P5XA48_9AGAR|nr:hypothetical protein P691DRAFT_805045 [Macrolepiota fuliginosa MF-IS2]